MIEYSYTTRIGQQPLYFLETDADVADVEAVLVDSSGRRHDLVEFEETPPDGVLLDDDGKRSIVSVADFEDGKVSTPGAIVRGSRWGRRVGARVPEPWWAEGECRVEWSVSGELVAVYRLTVIEHTPKGVTPDEWRRLNELSSADRKAALAAFAPKGD